MKIKLLLLVVTYFITFSSFSLNGILSSDNAIRPLTKLEVETKVSNRNAASCIPTIAIIASPGNSVNQGTTVVFSATPLNEGTSPSFQWKKNGNNVGTGLTTYTTSSLVTGDVIICVLTSNAACASPTVATSNSITMTVNPPVSNDEPCNATTVTVNSSCTFSTFTNAGSTNSSGISAHTCEVNANNDVWFKFVAPTSGKIEANTQAGSLTDAVMSVYSGTCGSLTSIACDDDLGAGNMPILQVNGLTPGTTYFVRISGFAQQTGTFGICLKEIIANDEPCNAILLNSATSCNFVNYTNTGATNTSGVSAHTCEVNANNDIWFKFTAPSSGVIEANTQAGTLTDAVMSIYSGTCTSLTSIACDDDLGAGNMPILQNLNVTPGSIYFVRISGFAQQTGTFGICIKEIVSSSQPSVVISANPGTTICAGTQVVFSATVSNASGTPTYQWKKNGNNVGTGLTTYTTSTLVNGDEIKCVITLSSVAYTSTPLIITVNSEVTPSIAITAQPGNVVSQGTNVTFTATPTNGGTTPTYQWKKNGVNVGTGLSTYESNSLLTGDVVTCALISNATCTSQTGANSNSITMTVNSTQHTVSIAASSGVNICSGTQVVFIATPTNQGQNPSYQWKKNGNNVGTGLATYTTSILNSGDVITCELTVNGTIANSNTLIMNVTSINNNVNLVGNTLISYQNGALYQWVDCSDNTSILSATDQAFTPTSNGSYQLDISLNGCDASSECQEVIISGGLGLKDLNVTERLVYPNPAKDMFTIKLSTSDLFEVKVIDLSGKLVYSGRHSNDEPISVQGLVNGNYTVLIENENFKITEKLIINK